MIDPPDGWKYGFPKPFTLEGVYSLYQNAQWFLENGYPQSEIDKGMLEHCRVWYEEVEGNNEG